MTRSCRFCGPLVSAWLATAAAFATAGEFAPPNVVIIVSDDQGYRDLGSFGSREIKTPHLDRLAAEGVRLTNFYVTWPACTPSRGSLLTGRYPQRNGIYDMIRNEAPDYGKRYTPAEYEVTFERIGGMDTREILLPKMLRASAFTCGIYGKWDLGSLRRFLPTSRGFDDFYGFVNTGIDYYTHERYGAPSMYRNEQLTTADKGTYCTYLFQREAMRFLAGNYQRPFFLYLPFNAPHSASNLDPAIRTAAQGPDEFKRLYPHLEDRLTDGTRYGKPARVASREKRRLEYASSVSCMDSVIGGVLDFLDQKRIADNTLVIFFSDNGGGGAADNSPLRGNKGQMFEGGIRVPCIVRFPGRIPRGSSSDAFLTSLEVLPTVLQATATSPPEGVKLDGYDMLPVLQGRAPSPRREMFWQRKSDKAARVGDWKWVASARGNGLFNLASDVGEQNDLSEKHPEKLRQLQTRFDRWRREMDAAPPRAPFRDF